MRRPLLAAALLATLASAVATAGAHHSLTAIYDRSARITVEGAVAEFRLVNPHAFLTMTVERDGRTETWRLELDNRYELADIGITAQTFRPGDRVVASGNRAHDGSRSMYALRIDRAADGFYYEQVGSTPRVGRSR